MTMRRNRMDYWMNLIGRFISPMCLFADEPDGGGAATVTDPPANAPAANSDADPSSTGADPTPTDTGEGKPEQFVPYGRFKEVIDKAKKFESLTKEQGERLAELEKVVASSQPKPGEKPRYQDPKDQAIWDKFFKPLKDESDAKVKALEEKLEFKGMEIQVQKELDAAQTKYAKMNRRDVYAALLDPKNADKSIDELAKASHDDRESFAKTVIEEYRKTKGGATPATMPNGESPAVATAKAPKEAKSFQDRMKWASKAAGQFLGNLKNK